MGDKVVAAVVVGGVAAVAVAVYVRGYTGQSMGTESVRKGSEVVEIERAGGCEERRAM